MKLSQLLKEDGFAVKNVKFDDRKGLGATPQNADIDYFGAVAWMTPAAFRALAHDADRSADAKKIKKLVQAGTALGTPFLTLTVKKTYDDDSSEGQISQIKVNGHEGRARADVIAALNGPHELMPVHLFFSGLRARDLKEPIWDFIRTHGIIPEHGVNPTDSGIVKVQVQGKTFDL